VLRLRVLLVDPRSSIVGVCGGGGNVWSDGRCLAQSQQEFGRWGQFSLGMISDSGWRRGWLFCFWQKRHAAVCDPASAYGLLLV